MRIGITGSHGFIGTHLLNKISNNDEYIIKTFEGNIKNILDIENFIQNLDVIVHLAGKNRGLDIEILETNTIGTFNLLKTITDKNPKAKLIFISSFHVYKQWDNFKDIDETILPQPVTIYGLSKKFAEELCFKFSTDNKINIIILRLSNVYGPGSKPYYNSVISTFINRAILKQPIIINGDGESVRDYIYISDVIEAIINSIQKIHKEQFNIYNICSGTLNSLNDIIQIIKKYFPNEIIIEYNKLSKKEKPFNKGNNKKAIASKIIGPNLVTLEKGLELMIKEEKNKLLKI